MGRSFSTRRKEHEKEYEKETARRQTRTIKDKVQKGNYKSAIREHCEQENHIMDWKKAKVTRTEDNEHQRWIREASEVRMQGP